MWAFSDLPVFNHAATIQAILSSWNSQFLGFHQEAPLDIPIPTLLLGILIRNDVITQKLFFLSILPLSVITMYIFVQNYFKSFLSKVFSSLLYAINPVTIGEFINGSIWMMAYALFPLVLYLLFKIYEDRAAKNIALYGLCASILIGLSAASLWILFWIFLPIPFAMFFKFFYTPKAQLMLFLKRSIFIFVFILIGLILLLPTVCSAVFIQSSAFRPQSIESYFKHVKYCYSKATPLNLLRLAGNAGSPMDALDYNEFNWWAIPSVIIPIIAFIPLINRKSLKCFFDLTLYLVICLVILFIFLTYEEITYSLFVKLPFLFSLRNPKHLMYSLAFCESFIFGKGLDTLFNLIQKSKFLNKSKNLASFFLLIVISSSLAVYAYPIWSGDMGLSKVRGDSYVVSQSYYEIASILKKRNDNNDFYRVLWLPYTYETQIRIVNTIQHFGTKLGQDILNTPSVEFVKNLFRKIEYDDQENFSEILALFNIKYVIVDKTQKLTDPITVYTQYDTPFIKGDPELFERFISKQNEFLKISETSEFSIYQNSFYMPYLSIVPLTELTKNAPEMKKLRSPTEQLFVYQSEYKTLYFIGNPSENSFNPINHYCRDKSTIIFKVSITKPSFITMAESYDERWVAYANGQKLSHWRACGWANGFLIPAAGEYEVEILFQPQDARNLMINVWLAAWGVTVAALVGFILKRVKEDIFRVRRVYAFIRMIY
jgi:hypothetical protein